MLETHLLKGREYHGGLACWEALYVGGEMCHGDSEVFRAPGMPGLPMQGRLGQYISNGHRRSGTREQNLEKNGCQHPLLATGIAMDLSHGNNRDWSQ